MCFFCGHPSWLWCCTSRGSMWAEDLPRVYINLSEEEKLLSHVDVNLSNREQAIRNTGDFTLFFFRGWKHNHEPESICWCVPVKLKWIGLYVKSRLEIQVNEQRHKSASEDWYWESAAVSLCQGHGCHAVNNTWRLSLHVCFHFSLLKCQQWKERGEEKKNHQYIVVAPCDLCRSSQKRWRHFNFVMVLFSFGFAWTDGSVYVLLLHSTVL